MVKEQKQNNVFKIIIILFIVFILVPIGIISLIYYSNDAFRTSANNYLRKVPGFIGDHFKKYPTEEERESKKQYLAQYYLSLNEKNAADKMYIIKQEDELLYNDIVKYMANYSSNKTKKIVEQVRNIELRKDLLFSIYEEVINEKESKIKNEAETLENLQLYLAVNEIENILAESEDGLNYILSLIHLMDEQIVADILYYLDQNKRMQIISSINNVNKRQQLDILLLQKEIRNNELKKIAKEYEQKDPYEAFRELGNTEIYSMEELAIIFMNLHVKNAAEILKFSTDNQFLDELFTEIREEERLLGVKDSYTIKINKAINAIKDYESKVDKLVNIYEKMNPQEVANIVEKMMINDNRVTLFEIGPDFQYQISDSTIILDILSRIKRNNLSEILNYLDTRKAAEITKRLAIE
ncbi:hypothetical protein [Thermohalobacter berrensis]|uniref:Uncharacterized protein n=1 Tax=Thermohalobacter berrensis TaxID=99594 RepID=A0A419TAF6_9FIRM|nr:hypothetical protein [Thermohalobacter berrensis]RKD34437.1 hypothetical protein BET03_00975 [Thermohalobacter berrensis]